MNSKRLAALTLTLGLTLTTTTAHAGAWQRPVGPCSESRYKITRVMPLSVRQDRNRALIRCVFERYLPSQTATALEISRRESGWDPLAWNRATDCRGSFQMLYRYWPGRVTAYLKERWFPNAWPHVSAFNARANALVAMFMVRSAGNWGAWSTS